MPRTYKVTIYWHAAKRGTPKARYSFNEITVHDATSGADAIQSALATFRCASRTKTPYQANTLEVWTDQAAA